MINRDSLGELSEALRRAEVSEISVEIAGDILANIGQLDPNDDLPNVLKDWLNRQELNLRGKSTINFIPSDHKGVCHDLLIAVCAGENNFDLNTIEAIALCINCHSTIKAVIIATDHWVEKQFNKWRKPVLKALHDQFGITFFIYTPHAGRWTLNPIAL
jgi:hypothetical protein